MRLIAIFSLGLLVASYLTPSLSDPDLWWHIVVGRWIVANQNVPSVDLWTQFGEGMVWRAYSWVFELYVALIDRYLFDLGLVLSQLAFTLLLFFSFYLAYKALSRSSGFALLLSCYSLAAIYNHISLRPQLIVWSLAALSIACLAKQGKVPWKRLIILIAFWANLHISTILGLLIIAVWSSNIVEYKKRIFLLLILFLASFLTPYLGGEWRTMFETATHPLLHDAVAEFKSANFSQYSTIFAVLLLIISVAFYLQSIKKIAHEKVVLSLVFLIAGLSFVKFLPFAILTLSAIVAELWSDQEVRRSQLALGFDKLINGLSNLPIQGMAFFLFCVSALNINSLVKNPLDLNIVPKKMMDFSIMHHLPTPYLNTFGQGGYIMYRYANQDGEVAAKVSIDGRTNLISDQLWRNFIIALNGREGWQRYIEQVGAQTIFWLRESPLSNLLREQQEEWCEVYRDGRAERGNVIFILNKVAQEKRLNCIGFKG
jgi:hypothetical protein